ncbi:hypothetical protein Tco_0411265 [Tanacetum coccineum]
MPLRSSRFRWNFFCWLAISSNYILNKILIHVLSIEDERVGSISCKIVERRELKTKYLSLPWQCIGTVTLLTTSVPRTSECYRPVWNREFDELPVLATPVVATFIDQCVQEEVGGLMIVRIARQLPSPNRLRADYGNTGSSATGASPLEEVGIRTDSVTVLHLHEYRSDVPLMTEATTVTIPTDVTRRSGSGFDAGSIREEEAVGASSEEVYVPVGSGPRVLE